MAMTTSSSISVKPAAGRAPKGRAFFSWFFARFVMIFIFVF
jgi:hypothetical protein